MIQNVISILSTTISEYSETFLKFTSHMLRIFLIYIRTISSIGEQGV
jgi:hypothetical protein